MSKVPSKGELAAATSAATATYDVDTRIAPDAFSAVLPALSALGAIASIAAVNWNAQDKVAGRARAKRKAQSCLRDLEGCCLGLQEIFRRFHLYPKVFAGEGASAGLPMKFGAQGTRVPAEVSRAFQQLVNDTASMLVLATQNAFDVMSAVEDGDIEAPETLFYSFAEQQERLNKLIKDRATLKLACDTGLDIADKLTGLVRELKGYRVE